MFDTKSIFFENIHTHRFLADVLTDCALRQPPLFLDVLRSEVDDGGIDLALSNGRQTQHIQLKARVDGRIANVPYQISDRLLETVGGAIIWIRYSKTTLARTDYFALVADPDKRLSGLFEFKSAKNRKGKPRSGYSLVPMRKANHKHLSVSDLTWLLFPLSENESAPIREIRG